MNDKPWLKNKAKKNPKHDPKCRLCKGMGRYAIIMKKCSGGEEKVWVDCACQTLDIEQKVYQEFL